MSGDLQQKILNSDLIYLLTRNFPNPKLITNLDSNNSDKLITVPANQIWELLWIWIEFIASAQSGNRQIQVDIRNTSNEIILQVLAANVQTTGFTEFYIISPFGQEPKETISKRHFLPIPPKLFLPAGYAIRTFDSAFIDSTVDDMIVQTMVNRFDV